MSSLPDLVAAPAQLRLGRKLLLLSPLTVGDLGIYERMGGQYDALLSGDNCKLLFWLSLRREHPKISYRQAVKMLRRQSRIERAAVVIIALNETAFRKDDKSVEQDSQAETSYAPIFKLLSRVFGWTVQEIASLTISQVNVYLRDVEAGGGDSIHFNSKEEAESYVARRKAARNK